MYASASNAEKSLRTILKMALILHENVKKSDFNQAEGLCERYKSLLAELTSVDPNAKRFLPDLQLRGSGAVWVDLENRLKEAELASAQMVGYLEEKLSATPGITYDRYKISIGRIANFFGMRMGKFRDKRMFESLGIRNVLGKNKTERIASVLRDTFEKDKMIFEQVVNTLINYHDLSGTDVDELNRLLLPIGYAVKDGKIVPTVPREIVEEEAKPFAAYLEIERILRSAVGEVRIADAYVDQSLFPSYFHDMPPEVTLKILTKKMFDKFRAVAKKFKQQKSNFEVRKSNKIHDRYLIIDRHAWMIGQSIKDAGKKHLGIVKIIDVDKVLAMFEKLWRDATVVL
jgi:hypothetical protein